MAYKKQGSIETARSQPTDRVIELKTQSDWENTTRTNVIVNNGVVRLADAVIESFERSAPLDIYSGDLTAFGIQSTTVYDGDKALQRPGQDTSQRIISTTGLDEYPSAGQTLWARTYVSAAGTIPGVLWGVQDYNNFYSIHYDTRDAHQSFFLRKFTAGNADTLAEVPASIVTGEFLTFEIDWGTDGTMTANIYDTTDTSLTDGVTGADTDYIDGGIGWVGGSNGSDMYYDYLEAA